MSLALAPNQICKYSITCPYNQGLNVCIGSDSSRERIFICDLVSDDGVFVEGAYRCKHDETGKMKVILENK